MLDGEYSRRAQSPARDGRGGEAGRYRHVDYLCTLLIISYLETV